MDTAEQERTRTELLALMKERGWSKAEVGRRLGVTGVAAWLRGKYGGDNAHMAELARQLLDTERDAETLGMRGLFRPADLAVTRQIGAALAHAHANADLVVVYGAAGAGKSWTAKRYCREHAGAWLVTMSPAVTTPASVLSRIARALHGGTPPEKTAARLETAVIDKLSVGRALLVADEAHHLPEALLDVIRCVHDEADCGLVLCGNEPLWARLAGGDRSAQLVSRVGLKLYLGKPSEADVLALTETLIGRAPAGAGRKAAIAVGGGGVGGLRMVRKLIAQAQILARGDGRDALTDEDIADAAELLGS